MCGILGMVSSDINTESIQISLQRLKHRGPDGDGVFIADGIALGHTRLAIQDTGELAAQPMQDNSGRYVIIYNGEIYNHHLIREKLTAKGVVFKTHSDTETLLYGFIYYGESILNELDGMFAFAILDRQNQTIFLARDASGIKPLYYYCKNNRWIFASEIKAILALTGKRPDVNYDALFSTLMLQWPLPDQSCFRDIHPLTPGYYVYLDIRLPGNAIPKKWSTNNYDREYIHDSEPVWIDRIDHALKQSLSSQLLSDRPVGYFLSGGIDSSLLYAMGRKYHSDKTGHAFCIDPGEQFEQEGFGRDLHYAEHVIKNHGGTLHTIKASPLLLHGIDKMVFQLEEPLADTAPIFVADISKQAAEMNIPVLVSGTGADDIFSGYRRHQALPWIRSLSRLPDFLLKGIYYSIPFFPGNQHMKRRLRKLLDHASKNNDAQLISLFLWADKHKVLQLFHNDIQEQIHKDCTEAFFDHALKMISRRKSGIDQLLHLEQQAFLPGLNLLYNDKMGMSSGVEIRVPYLGNEIKSLAASLPPDLKIRNNKAKYLLRQVALRYLPHTLINRKKTGFGAPIRQWIQHDKLTRHFFKERLDQLVSTGIFQKNGIDNLFNDTVAGKTDHAYTILALSNIESWHRQFIQGGLAE